MHFITQKGFYATTLDFRQHSEPLVPLLRSSSVLPWGVTDSSQLFCLKQTISGLRLQASAEFCLCSSLVVMAQRCLGQRCACCFCEAMAYLCLLLWSFSLSSAGESSSGQDVFFCLAPRAIDRSPVSLLPVSHMPRAAPSPSPSLPLSVSLSSYLPFLSHISTFKSLVSLYFNRSLKQCFYTFFLSSQMSIWCLKFFRCAPELYYSNILLNMPMKFT